MLSKRRSSDAAIQRYMAASEADPAAILGTGCFYKRGFGINNWKLRGYFIKADKKMVYFDTQSNETRGLVDLSSVSITRGPEENKLKCVKRFSTSGGEKGSASEQALACFSLLLITGHEDSVKEEADIRESTAGTSGIKDEKKEKKQRFELVFSTVREAKMFCFAVYCVERAPSVLQFIRFECWSDLIQKIDIMASEAAGRRRLSSADYVEDEDGDGLGELGDGRRPRSTSHPERQQSPKALSESPKARHSFSERFSEDEEVADNDMSGRRGAPREELMLHTPLSPDVSDGPRPEGGRFDPAADLVVHSGWFYKKGQLHRAWQLRYFELLSSGLLTYKKTAETSEIRGHLHLLSAELNRFLDMSVKVCNTPLFRRDGAEALRRNRTLHVSGLEIVLDDEERRTVLVSFDMEDPAANLRAEERFRSALMRVKSVYGRLHVSLLSTTDSEAPRSSEMTHLETPELEDTHKPSINTSTKETEATDFLSQDPELLAAVQREVEQELEPVVVRLRDWGQRHKERLVQVCAPLWFLSVLVLVQHPSVGMLLLFTSFSVGFGSLFEPFEKVPRPG